jgi:hypothetical protein
MIPLSVSPLIFIPVLLAVLGRASPTRNPLAPRTATASVSAAPSSTTTNSASQTTSFITTETNLAGAVIGCTSVSTLLITDGDTHSVSSSLVCIGAGVPLSTDGGAASSWGGQVSSLVPVSAPATGCSTLTPQPGGTQDSGLYCTCAGGGESTSAPPSSVPTILGFSRGTLTTACSTVSALPTDYVEVPQIALDIGNSNQTQWTLPPSGDCVNGEVLNPLCWAALDLDEYVSWWMSAFKNNCENQPFAVCFFIASGGTGLSPSNCNLENNECIAPAWDDFKGKWNGVRNFYVAVSPPLCICTSSCLSPMLTLSPIRSPYGL